MSNGLTIEELCSFASQQDFTLSSDGKEICFVSCRDDRSYIYLVSANGGFPRLCYQTRGVISPPQWAPQGERLAWSHNGITIFSLKKGTKKNITYQKNHRLLGWAPHGQSLLFIENHPDKESLWTTVPDGSLLMRLYEVKGKIHQASFNKSAQKILLVEEPVSESKVIIKVLSAEGEEQGVILEDMYPFYSIPTAQWLGEDFILFTSNESGYKKLAITNLSKTQKYLLLEDVSEECAPVIAPDGNLIAYSMHTLNSEDWLIAVQNIHERKPQYTVNTPGVNTPIAWSIDGTALFFVHEDVKQPAELWKADLSNNESTKITYTGLVGLAQNLGDCEGRFFETQGLKHYYCLYSPLKREENKKYPLVIWLKDYPQTPNMNIFSPQYHWLAQQGYIVASFSYSGSTGMGIDAMSRGIGEKLIEGTIESIQALVPVLQQNYPYIYADRICIGGNGWGAYLAVMAAYLLPKTFQAVFVHGLITDWFWQLTNTQRLKYFHQLTNKYYGEAPEFFQKCSPHHLLDNFTLPLFITHGKHDDVVPFYQIQKFIEKPLCPNRNIESHFYEDGHILSQRENLKDWCDKLSVFLKKNLYE